MEMHHTFRAAAIILLAGGLAACGVAAPGGTSGSLSDAAADANRQEPEKRRYVIYFDLGQTAVTDEGRRVLDILRKEIGDAKSIRIQVVGYTDRVGSAADNVKLAERRSAAVVAVLRETGVEGAAIETIALGEADPVVPTADGVPKAQNRRVEIFVTRAR